jgi:hypothetical protein
MSRLGCTKIANTGSTLPPQPGISFKKHPHLLLLFNSLDVVDQSMSRLLFQLVRESSVNFSQLIKLKFNVAILHCGYHVMGIWNSGTVTGIWIQHPIFSKPQIVDLLSVTHRQNKGVNIIHGMGTEII